MNERFSCDNAILRLHLDKDTLSGHEVHTNWSVMSLSLACRFRGRCTVRIIGFKFFRALPILAAIVKTTLRDAIQELSRCAAFGENVCDHATRVDSVNESTDTDRQPVADRDNLQLPWALRKITHV